MMDSLRSSDLRLLLSALEQVYAVVPLEQFPTHVFSILDRLIPEPILALDDTELSTGKYTGKYNTEIMEDAGFRANAAEHIMGDHPVFHYNVANPNNLLRVWRLTDCVSQSRFEQTGLYSEVFKPAGARFQLGIHADAPGHIGGITLNRKTNFTDRELDMVRLLCPHLVKAHANAKLFSQLQAGAPRFPEFSPSRLLRAGFTPREAEVLRWLMEGKRNAEIGIIINAKPRTISKHVENILAKLGVETRTAAAARAMEILQAR
jgi:DNA-binding CsgD family transcriptional regulator